MKTLVLYHTYTGMSKKLAAQTAAREGAALCELVQERRHTLVGVYTKGSLAAMRGRTWPIRPIAEELSVYDRLVIVSPVWAGHPTPAVNNLWQRLPAGKEIEVLMVSASGKSSCRERIERYVRVAGCTLSAFRDVKAKTVAEQ